LIAQWANRQLAGIVKRVRCNLRTGGIDLLAKIALLIHQPDGDYWNCEITRRFELIACDVSQPARVNGQGFAKHVFQAEVSDSVDLRTRMSLLEPRAGFFQLALGLE
jgi:hypothetical protein